MVHIVQGVANPRVSHDQGLIDFVQQYRQQAGLPVVSWHNHIVQPAVLTLALWSGLALWLGWR